MSNVTPLRNEHNNPFVTHAADEVRGIMASKRIAGYRLPELTHTPTSRGYWQRRLHGDVPFDLEDLYNLAQAFDMPIASLLERITADAPQDPRPINAKKTPTKKGGSRSVGLDSFDLPTSTVVSGHLAPVIPIRKAS